MMTSNMTHTVSEPIIEGFICPNCMKSFGTAELLKFHFDSDHKHGDHVGHYRNSHQTGINLSIRRSDSVPLSLAFYDQEVSAQPFGNYSERRTQICRSDPLLVIGFHSVSEMSSFSRCPRGKQSTNPS